MTPRATHLCAAPGCDKQVLLHFLMCKRHWKRVPTPLQNNVWGAWNDYRDGKIGVDELRAVQAPAIAAVAGAVKGGAA